MGIMEFMGVSGRLWGFMGVWININSEWVIIWEWDLSTHEVPRHTHKYP